MFSHGSRDPDLFQVAYSRIARSLIKSRRRREVSITPPILPPPPLWHPSPVVFGVLPAPPSPNPAGIADSNFRYSLPSGPERRPPAYQLTNGNAGGTGSNSYSDAASRFRPRSWAMRSRYNEDQSASSKASSPCPT